MERVGDIMQRRVPSYLAEKRRQARKCMIMTATVCGVIALLFAMGFSRMVTSIPPQEQNPPQTVQELLDALRPQILNP